MELPFARVQPVARAISGLSFEEWKALPIDKRRPWLHLARKALRADARYQERQGG